MLLVMLYGAVALGFRWGKKVGAGAERHAFRMHADRNGGYVYLGTKSGDQWGTDQPLTGV